jgi:hypothetical protein
VVDGLRANRLAAPFALEIEDDDYFLVAASERGEIRKLRLFRDWLLGEAR